MTTLKGFSPHLLLSVLYTQVEELHKYPPSPRPLHLALPDSKKNLAEPKES